MRTAIILWLARLLRCPVYRWHPRGPWWARLRRGCWYVLLRYDTELCDACGGRVRSAWWAEDGAWEPAYEAATGTARGGSGLLCERCYERGARSLGWRVEWRARRIR